MKAESNSWFRLYWFGGALRKDGKAGNAQLKRFTAELKLPHKDRRDIEGPRKALIYYAYQLVHSLYRSEQITLNYREDKAMAMIQVKCSNCGANLQMDDSNKTAVCSHCGSTYYRESTPLSINIENINVGSLADVKNNNGLYFSENQQQYAVPFSIDERQVKAGFLNRLMLFDNVPLDVAYDSKIISIDKVYYPVAFMDVVAEADWQATSIWEHEEKYQVAEDIIVYVDRYGKEHKSPGTDTVVRNGTDVSHPQWKPVSKTIYKTKKRTVIDSTQQTSGHLPSTPLCFKIWMGPDPGSKLSTTMVSWIDLDSDCLEVDDSYLNDFFIPEMGRTKDEAIELVTKKADESMYGLAREEVPGNRFEDFRGSSQVNSICMTTRYLCAYHIVFEYKSMKYDYYTSGEDKDYYYLPDHPIDQSFDDWLNGVDKYIKDSKSIKTALIITEVISIIVYILVLFPLSIVSGSIALKVVLFLISLIAVIGSIVARKKWINKRIASTEGIKADFISKLNSVKGMITELIQNDSIPDESKAESIKALIRDNGF